MQIDKPKVQKARPDNLTALMELFGECTTDMNSKGLYNWNKSYPDPETVKQDILEGTLYLCYLDGKIAAAVTLNENEPPEYGAISWSIPRGRILVVHRLAVSPNFRGRGLAIHLMTYAEELARKSYDTIHMDAYSINNPARNLYRKLGYRELEDFYFPGFEIPFTAMELCFVNESQG